MARPTIPGIYRDDRDGWSVDKRHQGHRLRHSGSESYQAAEEWFLARIAQIAAAPKVKHRTTFDQAAAHYLELFPGKPSIELEIWLLEIVMPFIGHLHLDQVYDARLEPFKRWAVKQGYKSKTMNLAIGVVRRILNLAARSWRDEDGKTWLLTAPLLSKVEGGDEREPMQLTWKQQREHLQKLPAHLARMALFDLNTGARDAVVCGLKWAWEIKVPELGISVFDVPRRMVKGRKASRILVCNSVAQSIVEAQRGLHPDYVFVWSRIRKAGKKPKYSPIQTMNNTAWQKWRREAGLGDFHVHDMRHTVGMRLRECGVREETRADILWHVRKDMPQHYALAQVREIYEALELITDEKHGWNKTLSAIARDAHVPVRREVQKKTG